MTQLRYGTVSDYDEACELTIGCHQAQREIKAHNLHWEDFVAEVGDKDEYSGAEILDWLGY